MDTGQEQNKQALLVLTFSEGNKINKHTNEQGDS